VLISGYTNTSLEQDGDTHKPDGFLGKPLMMSDIEKLLKDLL
jgi:hypothetical protein